MLEEISLDKILSRNLIIFIIFEIILFLESRARQVNSQGKTILAFVFQMF